MNGTTNASAHSPIIWARPGKSAGEKVVFKEANGNYIQWLVDGSKAMYEMCDAFCRATKFIYLIDSYFRPDINLVRNESDYQKLYGKYQKTLDAVRAYNKNNIEGPRANQDIIPLISLLSAKADQGVNVRIIIFHPDSAQDKMGGPFGWLSGWAIVKYWSTKIDLKLAMWGVRYEGVEIGAHHQKSAVVCTDNGLIGFCGGIDIAENRWNLPSHNLNTDPVDNSNPTPNSVLGEWNGKKYLDKGDVPLWHDVHVKVVGPAAYDLATNFAHRYINANTNLRFQNERSAAMIDYKKTKDYRIYPTDDKLLLMDMSFEKEANERARLMVSEIANYKNQSNVSADLLSSDEDYSKAKIWAQIVRTYYTTKDYSIWDVYKNLFSTAMKNIYIESQYAFEDERILGVLIKNVSDNKKLKVIIVAPLMPDNYDSPIKSNIMKLVKASSSDEYKLHPKEGATRVAAYSLSSNFGGKRIPIYVHAKIAIVDDTWAVVGSANLDRLGMSHVGPFKLDRCSSEIAMLVNGQDQALALRRMLVKEHLGPGAPNNIDKFDDVYEAFINAADDNGPGNSSRSLSDGVQVVFHRTYSYKE